MRSLRVVGGEWSRTTDLAHVEGCALPLSYPPQSDTAPAGEGARPAGVSAPSGDSRGRIPEFMQASCRGVPREGLLARRLLQADYLLEVVDGMVIQAEYDMPSQSGAKAVTRLALGLVVTAL